MPVGGDGVSAGLGDDDPAAPVQDWCAGSSDGEASVDSVGGQFSDAGVVWSNSD